MQKPARAYHLAGYLHPLAMEGAPPSRSLIDKVRSVLESNPQRVRQGAREEVRIRRRMLRDRLNGNDGVRRVRCLG